jgi:arylsulfatase A-like enzyme
MTVSNNDIPRREGEQPVVAEARPNGRPNILIFCTDEQRADHLGCMGHPVLKTPNIDRIAADGVLFRNCYSSSPVCMPARATMMTGLTNRASGVRTQGVSLPEDVPTLPGMLADAGYRTHAVGKLHLKPWGGRTIAEDEDTTQNPERRIYWRWPGRWEGGCYTEFPDNYYGFQTLDVVNGHVNYVYGDYVTWLEEQHPGAYEGYAYNHSDPKPLAIDPALHYNTWIADRSIRFIERANEGDGPFFLWCSFPDPHEPFAAVRKWSDRYADADIGLPAITTELSPASRSETMKSIGLGTEVQDPEWTRACIRQTYGMVSHVDEQVGRILDCLEEQGIADSTIVVYISDHGDQLGEHGLFYKGVYPYDGHAHIPFLARVPWAREKSKVVDDVVSMLDLVPTVLDLAGVSQPGDRLDERWREMAAPIQASLPGEVLTPVLTGDVRPVRRNALIEYDHEGYEAYEELQYRSLVTNDHKLVFYMPCGETMLFDRKNDPDETRNLADDPEHQGILLELFRQLISEISRTENRLPRYIGC